MTYNTLDTSFDNGIFTITMNRPSVKNAMSSKMMVEITEVLNETAQNNDIIFVVLTGAGDYYCSGKDLNTPLDGTDLNAFIKQDVQVVRDIVSAFINFPKLLISIVNGPAIGIAVTTLALCDLVFCTTTATFWTPFSKLGLCTEGCSSYLFPRLMGNSMANKILQFGQKIDAVEAKTCGLVADIYKPEEIKSVLWPKIISMKENLSKESLAVNKRLIRKWDKQQLLDVCKAECDELENCLVSEDFIQSILKFAKSGKKKDNKL